MEQTLTPEDVLSMAMDMEQTGRVFYEALAGATGDRRAADLFGKLAQAEAGHYEKFKQMRENLSAGRSHARWSQEQANDFHRMVKENIQPTTEEVRKVAIGGDLAGAVAMARKMEQDAIDFYTRMTDAVAPESKETVEAIVRSEQSHLTELVALAW